ncbi:MAG: insulinase family protein [Bacteroidia bacterium]|nr:insulinase family protein [Bacteroidia bacterium]
MLDRITPPEFKSIDHVEILHAKEDRLDNEIPVYSIDSGSQELVKIEFIFKAGMYFQASPLLAVSTSSMMENGTVNYTAEQISEHLDFYGSHYETGVGQDYSSIALYSLNKHLANSIYFAEDIIKNANFPQHEFETFLSNKKQKHLVNSKKVAVLARRKFSELIFGEKHPYGIVAQLEDYDKIKREHLLEFYAKHYNSANCTIVVSGKLPADVLKLLNDHFGKENWGSSEIINDVLVPYSTTSEKKHFVFKEDAIQSAIRIGRPMFSKNHPDYFKFQVLNTVFGGYFGSRLMANIREDKGYTYGIGSGLSPLVHGGYFGISTEVGVDVTTKCLEEIYKELKLMREELIPEEELQLVKNYITGIFLRSVDGPFSLADKFKGIWEFGLGYDYFDNYLKAVKTVTAQELKDLANKYLKEEDMIELVVGKKS